jgi:hypothetical protein
MFLIISGDIASGHAATEGTSIPLGTTPIPHYVPGLRLG